MVLVTVNSSCGNVFLKNSIIQVFWKFVKAILSLFYRTHFRHRFATAAIIFVDFQNQAAKYYSNIHEPNRNFG